MLNIINALNEFLKNLGMLRRSFCWNFGREKNPAANLVQWQTHEVRIARRKIKVLYTQLIFILPVSFGERIRILFWIAATNFVFPVLFSIAQLIVVLRPNVNVADVNDIVLVNTSIAVIGVVFAVVWAGSVSWQRDRDTTMYINGNSDVEKANDFKVSAPVLLPRFAMAEFGLWVWNSPWFCLIPLSQKGPSGKGRQARKGRNRTAIICVC